MNKESFCQVGLMIASTLPSNVLFGRGDSAAYSWCDESGLVNNTPLKVRFEVCKNIQFDLIPIKQMVRTLHNEIRLL